MFKKWNVLLYAYKTYSQGGLSVVEEKTRYLEG